MADVKILLLFLTTGVVSVIIGKLMVSWSFVLSQTNRQYITPFFSLGKGKTGGSLLTTVATVFPLAMGAVTGLVHGYNLPLLLSVLVAAVFLLQFTISDLLWQLIFDKQLALFALLGLLRILLLNGPFLDYVLAAGVGGGIFWLMAVITRGGIGGGDVKLIAALGLWLGTDLLYQTVVWGIILGGVGAILLLVTKKRQRKEAFPYGPYFAISGLVMLIC
ncbi:A24 family peptidase [uncultured Anaerovibrio sp.]|uniref:prepilin peptidase n=1 Tax=uncultured Anaerovibrio sp. TaxID=361586 RepID=UPI0025ECC4CE|nr:A24 family peptidase [uncultured Anaerovibrio sp.]